MADYILKNYLRKPIEWLSSLTCIIIIILINMYRNYFLLTPYICDILSVNLLVIGVIRFFQGLSVFSYKRNLRQLPLYSLSSSELPISDKKLFLGKGFKWETTHTQRLYDLKQNGRESYLTPGKIYKLVRCFEKRYESSIALNPLLRLLSSQSRYNPVRPLPPVGGNPAIHGIEPNEREIFLNLSDRVGHTMILGTTRVGKTRLLELMIASDIPLCQRQ